LETNQFSLPCEDLARFFHCDNATWTTFLQAQPGFGAKAQLYRPTTATASAAANCTAYSHVKWWRRDLWKNISIPSLVAEQQKFVACMGYAPPLTPLPTPNGLNLHATVTSPHPTILALGKKLTPMYIT
jgi:hypothetical protein